MELASLELEVLAGKLNTLLRNYYVNNVYFYAPNIFLFKFHKAEEGDRLLLIDEDLGLWLTEEKLEEKLQSDFLTKLRKEVVRLKVENVYSLKGERIVCLDVSGVGRKRRIVLEFFGGGNIVVLDEDGKIRLAEKEVKYRHRTIRRGEIYNPPPSRGLPLSEDIKLDFEGDTEVAKYIGRKVGIGRKFVEEIFFRSKIDKTKKASQITSDERILLNDTMRKLALEVKSSNKVYGYFENGELRELSFIELKHLEEMDKEVFEDLVQGLDKLLTPIAYKKATDYRLLELKKKLEEKRRGLENQRARLKEMEKQSSILREVASNLPIKGLIDEDLLRKLKEVNGEVKVEDETLYILGRKIKLESPWKASSKLFELAKDIEKGIVELRKAIERLEKESERCARELELSSKEIKTVKIRRRKWFEKFRWFYTSEGFFAIGGRDAATNDQLIKKYMQPNDLVFHAEIQGSPFFLLKEGRKAGDLSIKETAVATVSFSRAWKLGLLAADAYYVNPDQVSLSPPSGEYLPKGSFMIYGKRNFLKGLELRLAIGVYEKNGERYVICGPINAIRNSCKVYVEIEPGHIPQSEAAKKIMNALKKEIGEVPSLEDFQRALPSGGIRIIGIRKTVKNT